MKAFICLIILTLACTFVNAQDVVASSDNIVITDSNGTNGNTNANAVVPFSPVLQSVVTCPHCSHQFTETMRTDACKYMHQCEACGEAIKAKKENCCLHCSYGSSPCPPKQQENYQKNLDKSKK